MHANDIEELNHLVAMAADRIRAWMEQNELILAPEKTEAIILKGHGKKDKISIEVLGAQVQLTKKLKYLGVMIGQGTTFGSHIKYATEKADNSKVALRRITRNIGGPSSRKRMLLYGVIQSIMYAAPVWAEWIVYKKYRNLLISAQRKALLRVAMAYRTVSAAGIQVVTGVPPMDLLVRERCRIHNRPDGHTERAKTEERQTTLTEWQTRWDTQSETGTWTRKFIRNVKTWCENEQKNTKYYLTQVLTGHGTFGSYTKK